MSLGLIHASALKLVDWQYRLVCDGCLVSAVGLTAEPSVGIVSYSSADWPKLVHVVAGFQEKPESTPLRTSPSFCSSFCASPLLLSYWTKSSCVVSADSRHGPKSQLMVREATFRGGRYMEEENLWPFFQFTTFTKHKTSSFKV